MSGTGVEFEFYRRTYRVQPSRKRLAIARAHRSVCRSRPEPKRRRVGARESDRLRFVGPRPIA